MVSHLALTLGDSVTPSVERNFQMLPKQKHIFCGNQEHLQLWAVCLMGFNGSFWALKKKNQELKKKSQPLGYNWMWTFYGIAKTSSVFPLKAIAKCYPWDMVDTNGTDSGNFDHKPLKAPTTFVFMNHF